MARSRRPRPRPVDACPCGGGAHDDCCGRFLGGGRAPTAESLMRSRYSAFVLGRADHLLATWHPEHRPASIDFDDRRWDGLDVLATTGGGPLHPDGTVTFRARFTHRRRRFVMTETSRFARIAGAWFYVDGDADLVESVLCTGWTSPERPMVFTDSVLCVTPVLRPRFAADRRLSTSCAVFGRLPRHSGPFGRHSM